MASFILSAEIVIYANDPHLPQIGNAEVLNLENREVTAVQGEQWPGGQYQERTGRGESFHRGERFRHSTIGTQWQAQSIDGKIIYYQPPPSMIILLYLTVGVSTMTEAGHDQLRRSHSDQDLLTRQRQEQLARAAEFYTAVGPDGETYNKIIDEIHM